MSDVNSTEDRDQEERRKGWRERLGGLVRGVLRTTRTVAGGVAKSRTATYIGVAMMAAGAMMTLTGVGAVAGGPLLIAGAAVAAGSLALRVRDGAARGQAAAAAAASGTAPDRQPGQGLSSRSAQSRPPDERHAVGPPSPASDLDLTTHLAQATAALAQVVAALAAAQQQEQPTAPRQAPVQDGQNRLDRSSAPSFAVPRPTVNAALHSPPTARASASSRGMNFSMPIVRNPSQSSSDSAPSSRNSSSEPSAYRQPRQRGRGPAKGM